MSNVAPGSLVAELSGNWWSLFLRGLAALLFGVVALFLPVTTLLVMILAFGAYALVDGVLAVAAGVRGVAGPRWLPILEGIAGVLAGVFAFILPNFTAVALLYVIAAWAILTGILEILLAIWLRREIRGEWAMVLGGVFSVILGVILAILPGAGLLSLVWLIGAYAIVFGISLIVLAFRVRGRMRRTGRRVS